MLEKSTFREYLRSCDRVFGWQSSRCFFERQLVAGYIAWADDLPFIYIGMHIFRIGPVDDWCYVGHCEMRGHCVHSLGGFLQRKIEGSYGRFRTWAVRLEWPLLVSLSDAFLMDSF